MSKPYNDEKLALAIRRTFDDDQEETIKPSMNVVGDDPDVAEFVSNTAKSIGFEVRVAASAKEFMDLVSENEPWAIVMDIVIPDMDGIELLDWLTI